MAQVYLPAQWVGVQGGCTDPDRVNTPWPPRGQRTYAHWQRRCRCV